MAAGRAEAYKLLTAWVTSESLLCHSLAVEACMRALALKEGAGEELWAITGLLHDFDYERYPSLEDHPFQGVKILSELGYPAEVTHAILGHGNHTGTERVSRLDKALFAVDELSGFVSAVAMVRPSRSMADVKVSSVKKKLKDKAFARGVSREDIISSAQDLGVGLDEHIGTVIAAMQSVAPQIGLG